MKLKQKYSQAEIQLEKLQYKYNQVIEDDAQIKTIIEEAHLSLNCVQESLETSQNCENIQDVEFLESNLTKLQVQ